MSVARIQLRRDTAANWTSANTILNPGEVGFETDTSKAKIGDGTTAWTSLTYFIYRPAFTDLTSTPSTLAGYGITDAFSGSFDDLTNKPTTISGYGITDAFNGQFSSLTGTPTTIAGYGITDAFNGQFSSLSGKPTTIAGYGITDAFDGNFSSLANTPTTIAGYGITDAFNGQFSSLQALPSTLAGYGITDAFTGNFTDLTNTPTTIAGYGITDALTSVAFSDLTSTPTTRAGYGITDAAPINSPGFTGAPTAPTASSGNSTTQLATTAFVQGAISPFAATQSSSQLFFQDTAPIINAYGEMWFETDTGAVYKAGGGSATIPLDNSIVSSQTGDITTIPAASASDTRIVLPAGTPDGEVILRVPVFFEEFAGSGVNIPEITTITYVDGSTGTINAQNFTRSSGNAFDVLRIKSFSFQSTGSINSNPSHITLTISGYPEWQIQESHLQGKLDALVDSAPTTLDTLNELAAALNDDASFATTVTNSLATKAPLSSPALTGAPTAPTPSSNSNNTNIATTAFVQGEISSKTIDRTGVSVSVGAASGAGNLAYDNQTGVFSFNPASITSIPFSGITGKPTTVGGYGITNALTTGADADIGTNNFLTTGKIYYGNDFSQLADLPSATTYAGMFAHVHATGAAYFAYNGNWIELATVNNSTTVQMSDSAPTSGVTTGDLWFDTTSLQMFIYYNDGDSAQWVQTNPSGAVQGGVDPTEFAINSHTRGELQALTGVERWYAPYNIIITEVQTNLATAADDTVTAIVKKDGGTFITLNLSAGDTSASLTGQSLTMNSNSYLTVDITATGTADKGEDLYVQLKYRRA
ncbi:MAG: hypothetical protein CBB92_13110 [Flammeovirgaceae bacterium TMED32]|nr:MAG: hypothetical protein CBB92_13110 [Flammeovirgaceae bacterium TMED32]